VVFNCAVFVSEFGLPQTAWLPVGGIPAVPEVETSGRIYYNIKLKYARESKAESCYRQAFTVSACDFGINMIMVMI